MEVHAEVRLHPPRNRSTSHPWQHLLLACLMASSRWQYFLHQCLLIPNMHWFRNGDRSGHDNKLLSYARCINNIVLCTAWKSLREWSALLHANLQFCLLTANTLKRFDNPKYLYGNNSFCDAYYSSITIKWAWCTCRFIAVLAYHIHGESTLQRVRNDSSWIWYVKTALNIHQWLHVFANQAS